MGLDFWEARVSEDQATVLGVAYANLRRCAEDRPGVLCGSTVVEPSGVEKELAASDHVVEVGPKIGDCHVNASVLPIDTRLSNSDKAVCTEGSQCVTGEQSPEL